MLADTFASSPRYSWCHGHDVADVDCVRHHDRLRLRSDLLERQLAKHHRSQLASHVGLWLRATYHCLHPSPVPPRIA